MGLAQGAGRNLRQANAANMAFFYQVSQRAHAVLDGYFFVPAVQVIEIDHVGLQATQAVFAVFAYGCRAAVNHTHNLPVAGHIHAMQSTFAGQGELAAMRLHDTADQCFIRAKAIQRGGIEQRHTGIQRGQQHTLALLRRHRRSVGMAEVHATQADGAYGERAQLSRFHGGSFEIFGVNLKPENRK
ncbi:hypothetical protein D9M73_98530 [compost metagenome]